MDDYDDELLDFGQRLRAAREVAGLSLDDAATIAGLDPCHLEQTEAGEFDPPAIKAAKLAATYGVTFDWLSGLVDNPWELWEPRQK